MSAKAEKLSDVESKRLQVLVQDAKEAKADKDLERVADLLAQAIAIKADPSFRWNLARVYEELCMFPAAALQFEALAKDKTVMKNIREQSELRVRGLKRQREAASFRVALKTANAKLYVDGEDTPTDKERIRFYRETVSKHVFEIYMPGSWRTRIRTSTPNIKRCVTVNDDLEALPPTMARLRIAANTKLASFEINGYRLRADLANLKEIEVEPGEFVIEARTTKGTLMSARAIVNSGGVANVKLSTSSNSSEPVLGKRLNRLHEGVSSQSQVQLWGWITLGAGIALTGGGVTLLALAHSTNNQERENVGTTAGVVQADAPTLQEDIDGDARTSIAVLGVGAAAALVGLFFVLSDDSEESSTADADMQGPSDVDIYPGLDGSLNVRVNF